MTASIVRRTVADLPRDPNPGPHHRIVALADVLEGASVDAASYGTEDIQLVLDFKRDDYGFPALVDSIAKYGLGYGCAPCITFYDFGDPNESYWYIQEGHHRIAALQALGARWIAYQGARTGSGAFFAPDGSQPAYHAH